MGKLLGIKLLKMKILHYKNKSPSDNYLSVFLAFMSLSKQSVHLCSSITFGHKLP
jgi:hypothetical protein